MIDRTSRYYDGSLSQSYNSLTNQYDISVLRTFPTSQKVNYIFYTWKEGDNLSDLGYRYSGGATYWWEIMDLNPEITDPLNIQPGDVIRIPYGNQ